MDKRKIFAGLVGLLFLALARPVGAFCPLCVVSTGAGVGLLRWLGVDDGVVGIWLGGFGVALAGWLNRVLQARGWQARWQLPGLVAIFWLLQLFLAKMLGIWRVDRFLFGLVVGSVLLLFVPRLDGWLKKQNGGRVVVPFQKIVLALLLLGVGGLIFQYWATRF